MSDRVGAAVGWATLKAFGIITDEDKRHVVDGSKFRGEGQKCTEDIRRKEKDLCEYMDSSFVDVKGKLQD